MNVIFCCPTITHPYPEFVKSVEQAVPVLDANGIEHRMVFEVGSVYISWARANMLQKALKTDADTFVFFDHDLSWKPEALLKLLQHPGDVVAGDYRFKKADEEYMSRWDTEDDDRPSVRPDGTIRARAIPAGFLKVTRKAVERIIEAYPELLFGPERDFIDLFNHGAYGGLWWGEDFAFSRRWRDIGGEIYLIPDLDITHHLPGQSFPGNLHEFLLRQPGGSKEGGPAPAQPKVIKFTRRQKQVAELVRQGKQDKVIAYELGIAEATVKIHLRQVMKKLKATNRTQVAVSTLLQAA